MQRFTLVKGARGADQSPHRRNGKPPWAGQAGEKLQKTYAEKTENARRAARRRRRGFATKPCPPARLRTPKPPCGEGNPVGADRGARVGGGGLPVATRKTKTATRTPKPPACPAQGAQPALDYARKDISPARPLYATLY